MRGVRVSPRSKRRKLRWCWKRARSTAALWRREPAWWFIPSVCFYGWLRFNQPDREQTAETRRSRCGRRRLQNGACWTILSGPIRPTGTADDPRHRSGAWRILLLARKLGSEGSSMAPRLILEKGCPVCNGRLDPPAMVAAELRATKGRLSEHERLVRVLQAAQQDGGEWYCAQCRRGFSLDEYTRSAPDRSCPQCGGAVFLVPRDRRDENWLDSDASDEHFHDMARSKVSLERWQCESCGGLFDFDTMNKSRRPGCGLGLVGWILPLLFLAGLALLGCAAAKPASLTPPASELPAALPPPDMLQDIRTLEENGGCSELSMLDSLVSVEIEWMSKKYNQLFRSARWAGLSAALQGASVAVSPTESGETIYRERKADARQAQSLLNMNAPSLETQLRLLKGIQGQMRRAMEQACANPGEPRSQGPEPLDRLP